MSSKKVSSYQLLYIEGVNQKAYISCWDQGKFQGYIDFYELDKLPSPGINSNGSLHLAYPIDRLDGIVQTLREESPIYIQVAEVGSFTICRILTSNEAVGEQEGLAS
ncbi:MAG TPA: hypothetical protein EYN07_01415 [Flavobacteriaceae bacterium]|jgi:hypothetical protein|nr:hypothetical protein [Flavobacteriaceae bacterium]MAM28428.1 hypothetical protein [Flavobacteriaceae bacterium]MAY53048.1 hypothetical protein [Flavobacteriaceae bacterium]HBR53213.1 hypothetical protein [Flavobacteriaceae bacterium]HIB48543.1 hypothetical protein [Flavobacteriaceae bacterium]|tara:strand:+ start:1002 stop:1322 length:321 start_codon:yes stop_codon:yes gene_type:complete